MKGINKQFKRAWHERMRPRACDYSGGKCQGCGQAAEGANGVIHHLKYPTGCYHRDVEDLIRERICQWLCRKCHDAIHVTEAFAEAQNDSMKRGAHCKICGKLSFGVWDRAKYLRIDFPICKRCSRKRMREQQLEKAGQMNLFVLKA